MTLRTTIVFLTLLLLPLAGCIQPEEPGENGTEAIDGPSWGLGLTIPPTPPEAGPYIEGEDTIQSLHTRLNAAAPHVRAMCKETQPSDQGNSSVEDDRFIRALWLLFSACKNEYSAEARQRATQDEASGQYPETYRELHHNAWAAFNASLERVSSLPPPGSLVDVAVQSAVQGEVIFLNDGLNTAGMLYKSYEDGRGNHLSLASAYLNLIRVINAPRLFDAFLDAWTWDKGSCQAPEPDELREEVEALVADALRAIERYGDSQRAGFLSSPEGRLLKVGIPSSQWALEMGWWPHVLSSLEEVAWLTRTVETADDAAWPTREEALYLVAQHRAERRSITTEHHLAGLHENILQNPDWEQFPNEARAALATPALQPRVALTPCDGP